MAIDWQSIDTAPKDGSRVLCWAPGWEPLFLIWKTNHRIVQARSKGEYVDGMQDSYFGDPWESDDYELAKSGPTHWLPLPPPPPMSEEHMRITMTYEEKFPIGSRVAVRAFDPSLGSDHEFHAMTYYYYIKPDRSGYWTPSPPCFIKDQYLAAIDADEMPTQTPFEMQANQARALAKSWNPYQP